MKNKKENVEPKKKSKRSLSDLTKNVGEFVSSTAEKSQERIMKVMDRNEDGSVTLDDFGLGKENLIEAKDKAGEMASETRRSVQDLAFKANENIKQGVALVDKALADSKLERDRKNLRPVFHEDLLPMTPTQEAIISAVNDTVCNMVRIVERDKKREENIVSKGAIGYWTTASEIEVLNLYEDVAKDLSVSFYPLIEKTVYYIHPFQKNLYIKIDEYFAYLKTARVAELEMIASELGAKKVTITLKEFKSNFAAKTKSIKAKAKKSPLGSGSKESKETDVINMEIAANLTFTGHDTPRMPQLVYFKHESDVEQLIKLRTSPDKKNQLISKTYALQYSKSSGIKDNTAAQIDAALLKMNYGASMSNEAKRETRTILEYHIEF